MLVLPVLALLSWQGAPLSFSDATLVSSAARRSTTAKLALTDSEQRVAKAMELKPVAETSARSTGLALALDDGTRKSHSMAENTAFVTGFFRGIATKAAFSQLVAALYFVYVAMEEAFEASDDASVCALDFKALRRVPALEQDMEYYFGSAWRDEVAPSAATLKYVARIQAVAKESPHLLVAHMYTRYLGEEGQPSSDLPPTFLPPSLLTPRCGM